MLFNYVNTTRNPRAFDKKCADGESLLIQNSSTKKYKLRIEFHKVNRWKICFPVNENCEKKTSKSSGD